MSAPPRGPFAWAERKRGPGREPLPAGRAGPSGSGAQRAPGAHRCRGLALVSAPEKSLTKQPHPGCEVGNSWLCLGEMRNERGRETGPLPLGRAPSWAWDSPWATRSSQCRKWEGFSLCLRLLHSSQCCRGSWLLPCFMYPKSYVEIPWLSLPALEPYLTYCKIKMTTLPYEEQFHGTKQSG